MNNFHPIVAAFFAALAIVVTQSSEAQVVPYKAFGTGEYYPAGSSAGTPAPGDFFGPGYATHMGKMQFFGNTIPTGDPTTGVLDWSADIVQVAANGDELWLSGGGQVFLFTDDGVNFTAMWTGLFDVVGGAGRFSEASSPQPLFVMACNDPFVFPPAPDDAWTFDWIMEGKIDLGKR